MAKISKQNHLLKKTLSFFKFCFCSMYQQEKKRQSSQFIQVKYWLSNRKESPCFYTFMFLSIYCDYNRNDVYNCNYTSCVEKMRQNRREKRPFFDFVGFL